MSPRDRRRVELYEMQSNDPSKLVGMYRYINDLDELGRLPKGSTFVTIIEAILDHEEASGKLTVDSSDD